MSPDELALRAHQEWLGYLQPSGLVVSPPALAAAQAFPQKNIVPEQQRLLDLVGETEPACLNDFPRFTRDFLGWEEADLAGGPGGPDLPETLSVALPEYGETLEPTYAVPDTEASSEKTPEKPASWLLLIKVEPRTVDLDTPREAQHGNAWNASPQLRFERLLRENAVPTGLLTNGTHVRLVHAPRGESSGFLTFPVAAMCEVAGRPIVAALHMLLSSERLFSVPTNQRLPAILRESRKYQNQVSTRLAGQVLGALYELLRGFQAANEATKGELLKDVLAQSPQDVYGGLLGTLMRLVFILYAEDRGLMSGDPVYQQHYSVGQLFERLRDDNARHPDTMKDRHGAWAQLLTLFRLIHDGASHGGLHLPARQGRLFDPDTWDFLEGRPYRDDLDRRQRLTPPRVPDGVVHRVLENLIVLDGERISYRALDVEQIGSVYEAMMGFELRVATGPSLALRPDHVVVDLAKLLDAKPADRLKQLDEEAGCKLSGKAADAVKGANTVEDLVAALERRASPLTQPIAKGGLFLQPTDERRRSGSHYTPRSLTEPIVRTTLDPILKALAPQLPDQDKEDGPRLLPRPEQILALKVCDPAMGSGAFLVEACRYLGAALVASWQAHGETPKLPPDEELDTHARRLVATHCLYGADKNERAVDLAKLSLWLATLAKDHPFTFLDHALRHGDSLVGLTREQIASFHWKPEKQIPLIRDSLKGMLALAIEKRAALHALGDTGDGGEKQRLHEDATKALSDARICADLVIAAFFGKEKEKDREILRTLYADQVLAVLEDRVSAQRLTEIVADLYHGPKPVPPFHWDLEFPEVFTRDNPGFDAFVGNPPFLGGTRISTTFGDRYRDFLLDTHESSHGNADLVAYFFRSCFVRLRTGGTFGLIATKTIAQGDTRFAGLRWLVKNGGSIYAARKRYKWPGRAAVIVSIVHVARQLLPPPFWLDERPVHRLSAFLFHAGGDDDPGPLLQNAGLSFLGSKVYGQGFVFDDSDPDANTLADMQHLIIGDPRNRDRIFPYLSGEEINDNPEQRPRRHVLGFGEMSEAEARRWPDLMALVERRVRPGRLALRDTGDGRRLKQYWWQWGRFRPELHEAMRLLPRVLACSGISKHLAFAWCPTSYAFSHNVNVFVLDRDSQFAVLQSRPHAAFATMFASTLEDRQGYRGSDCFEPFPLPNGWRTDSQLEETGKTYYDFRAALMVRNNEGLTKTYNRFHDPEERDPDILRLRELHDAMDRAVLDAYGWALRPKCEFLLDYEDDDEEADGKPRKKKPWRYRWPDSVRDDVLARLLALNQERAAEEALQGQQPAGGGTKRRPTKRKEQPGTRLFD